MLKFSTNRKRVYNTYRNECSLPSIRMFDEDFKYTIFFTWIVWFCIGGAILLLFVISGLQVYRSITTSSFFNIERINIHGANFFHKNDILTCTKLQTGINSFSVNIGTIEKTLRNNPWVEKVSVKRKLPNAFDIFITEYEPTFWMLKNGIIYYADNSGKIITTVDLDNFKSFPTLEILDGGKELLPIVKELTTSLQTSTIDMSVVSAIRLSAAKGIEIVIENYDLVLCFEADRWKSSLKKLWSVLSDLANRNELKKTSQISVVAGNVWVTQKNR